MNGIENLVTTSSKLGWGFDAVEELHQGKQGMVAIGGFGFHLMCVVDFVVFEVFKGWEARALLRHGSEAMRPEFWAMALRMRSRFRRAASRSLVPKEKRWRNL